MLRKPTNQSTLMYANAPRKHTDPSVWKLKLHDFGSRSDTLARILVESALVSQEDMCESCDIAQSLRRDLDQVLVTSGLISGKTMQECLKAVDLIRDNKVTLELGMRALVISNQKGIDMERALSYLGFGW